MKMKKAVSILLCVMLVFGIITGCGNSGQGDVQGAEASSKEEGDTSNEDIPAQENETVGEEEVTLTYWGWDTDSFKNTAKAYEKSHPNVHFEVTAVEWGDMMTKTQQALASDSELPVLLPMDNALIENWKSMDIFEDLTQYGYNGSDYADAYVKKATTSDGRIIGAYTNTCPAGIVYKRDLAKEYFGTDDPDELGAMFTSYDDYIQAGKDVREKSGGKVYLFHSGQALAEWFYFASEIVTQTDNTINYTEKMTDVFSKLIALRDSGAVDSYQNGTPEGNATYADSTHIFYPCPYWAITYYIMTNDAEGSGNWGAIKAPVSYNHGGKALGITSASTEAQKQAAYDFIRWSTAEEEGAVYMRDEEGAITPYKAFLNDSEFTKSEPYNEFFGGQDLGKLYFQDIISEMKIAEASSWENDLISVRNDVSQQLMDDPDMTLESALELGKEELAQLVTDTEIVIE